MAGKSSAENGKKGGRPKGRKNDATIQREVARELFQQLVMQRIRPLFEAQMTLARGVSYLYRIDETAKGGREHVIVTDPDEIGDILAQMDEGMPGEYNDHYYYISTKAPDNPAIKDMLDRTIGKAPQSVDVTTNGKELPTPILARINYGENKGGNKGV